jgi:hypothetical protein
MDSIKKQYISRKVVIVGAGDVVIFNCGGIILFLSFIKRLDQITFGGSFSCCARQAG